MIASHDFRAATSYLNSGAYKSALKMAKRLQSAYPRDPAPWNIAGICLSAMNKFPASISQFQRALKIDPGFVDARHNLAQTLILAGRFEHAIRIVSPLRETDPKACYFLAQAQSQLGALDDAEASIGRALELQPRFAPALNLRGLILTSLGRENDALICYEKALTLDPDNVETLVNISLPLARQNRHAEGHQMVQRAVDLAPNHVGARLRLGTSFIEAGDYTRAKAQFHEVLKLAPGNSQAFDQLTRLADRQDMIALEDPVKRALKKVDAESIAAAELHFAASRIHEAAAHYDAAATSRHRANGILAQIFPYDAAGDAEETARILGRFPTAPLAQTAATTGPCPIYVLGLPRSGTSLVEAMLSRLPDVAPLGERTATGVLVQDILASDLPFDDKAARSFARHDQALLPDLPGSTLAYVDKMPENYRYIGFLCTAYPQCKIVHVRRDPRDVALSMWRTLFSGRALAYTYDLTAMAQRFGLYARLMAHWEKLFPEQILTIDYEAIVAEPVAASQSIAGFCGLEWTPDMSAPEASDAPTLTASASQIRQPVHQRSVGAWRQNADELAEFLGALDRAYWPGLQD
ncbi:sulfotransferase [Phaeobacter sp. PT47_59]|uniref:tetratricopeptide repeat-containing sulfotransferase family protein n=1 Tax=Phaeobacter sp. PT47_59 TaxID=3029979 RepID=UPI002380A15F|nr:tetratricopeptide repeat-containing sulfotransferase family protein [Phaeobacter sp. PT47_59]MDE4176107.1 sulfotransferase [Phaeobacter sp. PT47_59]